MIDLERVRLLTKSAIYEKREGKRDKRINEYYRNDYIYKNNLINRIGIFVGICLLFILILIDMIYVKQIDIATLSYKDLGIKFGVTLLLIFGFYTVVGIFKYGKEYDISQIRYKRYFSVLSFLDKPKIILEDTDGGSDETDFTD